KALAQIWPIPYSPLLYCDGYHLSDVTAQYRDALARQADQAAFRPDLVSQALELVRACYERCQVETESVLDTAVECSPRVALPIRTIPSNDQTAADEREQMPPQRRARHSVCSLAERGIRRKNDQVTGRQRRLRNASEQRVQDGQRAVGDVEALSRV